MEPGPRHTRRRPLTANRCRSGKSDVWPLLAHGDRIEAFLLLPRDEAEDFFFGLQARDQADVVLGVPAREQRSWLRRLPPDDAADLIQAAPIAKREHLLALLDEATRREVTALLAYSEDNAGGLMNPRYVRVRQMTVDEAISYVRKQMRELTRTIYYVFVLDSEQRLMGVVSFRALFNASVRARVADIMRTPVIAIPEQMDQEAVATKFAPSRLLALPVVDVNGRMQGIVTADDVVDVVRGDDALHPPVEHDNRREQAALRELRRHRFLSSGMAITCVRMMSATRASALNSALNDTTPINRCSLSDTNHLESSASADEPSACARS